MEGRNSQDERKEYMKRQAGGILALGFAYYLFSSLTGIYIPCIFRVLTGLKCPGCGATHYAIAMLHGRIHEAFAANELLFILMPAILIYCAYRAHNYIRTGNTGYSRLETAMLFTVLAITVGFGILRNIYFS